MSAAVVGTAAEPVVSGSATRASASRVSRGSGISLTTPAARPRAAAFVSGLDPLSGPSVRFRPAAVPAVSIADGYDLIVFAPHRPIRVQAKVLYEGMPPAERWTAALRTAFDGFDRDRDGSLSGYEVQYIFSDASLMQLMQTGNYAPNPNNLPTLARLDTDGDRRVSFPEFAAYYRFAAGKAVQSFPPFAENPASARATEALFKLFDVNADGKLTRDEVGAAEALLATKDGDEDECLSLAELLPTGGTDPRLRIAPVTEVRGGVPAPPPVPQNVVVYETGRVPGTLTQRVLKQYDKDNDFELTKAESGFDAATFARLDADGNGKLTGAEFDVWRTGPADLDVTLSLAPLPADCKVEVATDAAAVEARGFTVRKLEDRRMVVHHARQPIEFWSYATVVRNNRATLKQQWAYLFQQAAGGKDFVREGDIGGQRAPQFQLLRVLFDAADTDVDAKLTRAEFDRYFDLQQGFVDIATGLTPAVQTPTLFQLLDENRDGRLGVRELRTAWDRLIVLEPTGPEGPKAEVVTRAAIQPAVSVRLSRTTDRFNAVNQQVVFLNGGNPTQASGLQKGPVWFRKMDRNADGDVSRVEFLGTRAEFDALDADHDGLISLDEAEAYDKKLRPAGK